MGGHNCKEDFMKQMNSGLPTKDGI